MKSKSLSYMLFIEGTRQIVSAFHQISPTEWSSPIAVKDETKWGEVELERRLFTPSLLRTEVEIGRSAEDVIEVGSPGIGWE